MVHFAITGITSFTNYPLKIIMAMGAFVFLGSIVATGWVVWVVLTGRNVPGWASITLPIYFLGGIQLLSVGILGEYISKIYLEAKARPHYHVEDIKVQLPTLNHSSERPKRAFQKDLSLQKQ